MAARRKTPDSFPVAPTEQPATEATPVLIPLVDWPDHHPWPPLGGLRHLAFHADSNGFAAAFVRVGKRVLVDEREFFRAVAARNQSQRAPAAPTRRRRGRAGRTGRG